MILGETCGTNVSLEAVASYGGSGTFTVFAIVTAPEGVYDENYDFTLTATSLGGSNSSDGSTCASPYVLTAGDGLNLTSGASGAHSTSNDCAGFGAEDGTSPGNYTMVGTTHLVSACGAGSVENSQFFEFTIPSGEDGIYNIFIGNQSCFGGAGIQYFITDVLDCASPSTTGSNVMMDTGGGAACLSTASTATKTIEISLTSGTYYIVTDGFGGDVCDYDILITKAAIFFPVELLEFSGREEGRYNALKWATASEINNDYFEVQRSADGRTFETIGYVDGNGNSTQVLDYTFIDREPLPIGYYRLRQVDFDGSYEYTHIIQITRKTTGILIGEIHPSPTFGATNIFIQSSEDLQMEMNIFDTSGRRVLSDQFDLVAGSHNPTFDMSQYPDGLYLVVFQFDNYRVVKRLVKKTK